MRRHSSFKPLRYGGHCNVFRTALQQRQKHLGSLDLLIPSEVDLQTGAHHASRTAAAATATEDKVSTSSEGITWDGCMVPMPDLQPLCQEHDVPKAEGASSNKRKLQLVDKRVRSRLKAIMPEPALLPTPEQQAPEKAFQALLTLQVLKLCQSASECLPISVEAAALVLQVPLVLDREQLSPVDTSVPFMLQGDYTKQLFQPVDPEPESKCLQEHLEQDIVAIPAANSLGKAGPREGFLLQQVQSALRSSDPQLPFLPVSSPWDNTTVFEVPLMDDLEPKMGEPVAAAKAQQAGFGSCYVECKEVAKEVQKAAAEIMHAPSLPGCKGQTAAAAAAFGTAAASRTSQAEVAGLLVCSNYSKQPSMMDLLAPGPAAPTVAATDVTSNPAKPCSIFPSPQTVMLRAVKDACGAAGGGKCFAKQAAALLTKQPPAVNQPEADASQEPKSRQQQETASGAERQQTGSVSREGLCNEVLVTTPAGIADEDTAAVGAAPVSGPACPPDLQASIAAVGLSQQEGRRQHTAVSIQGSAKPRSQRQDAPDPPHESELMLEVPILDLMQRAGAQRLLHSILQEITADVKASLHLRGTSRPGSCHSKSAADSAGEPSDRCSCSQGLLQGGEELLLLDPYSYPLQTGWISSARPSAAAGASSQGQQQQVEEGAERSRKHQRSGCLETAGPPAAAAAGVGASQLEDLLAKDMQPEEDGIFTLPMVFFDERSAGCQAQSGADSWKEMLLACGYRKQPSAHLELYMDWSLLRQCVRPAAKGAAVGSKLLCGATARAGGGRLRPKLLRQGTVGEGGVGAGAFGIAGAEATAEIQGRARTLGSSGDLEGLAGVEEEVCAANWEAESPADGLLPGQQRSVVDDDQGTGQWEEDPIKWITKQPIVQRGFARLPAADIEVFLAESWKGVGLKVAELLATATAGAVMLSKADGIRNLSEVLPAAAAKVLGLEQSAGMQVAAAGGSSAAAGPTQQQKQQSDQGSSKQQRMLQSDAGATGGCRAALVQPPACEAAAGNIRAATAAAGEGARKHASGGQPAVALPPAPHAAAAAAGAPACPAKQALAGAAYNTTRAAAAPEAAADRLPGGRKRPQGDLSDMDYFVSLHSAHSGPQSSKRFKQASQGAGLREDMAGVVHHAPAAGEAAVGGAAAGVVLSKDSGALDPAAEGARRSGGFPLACEAVTATAAGGSDSAPWDGPQAQLAAEGPHCNETQGGNVAAAITGSRTAACNAAGTPGSCAAEPSRAADLASIHTLQLPPHLLSLLRQLQSQRDDILLAAGLGHTHLMTAELWDIKPVDELLSSCSQAKGQQGAAEKAVIKALVSILLLGQAALCLAHFGVRVGHLFFSQSLQQLPAVAKTCKGAAEVLAAAEVEVMEKQLEDHPKQTKLRQVLMGIDAMHPGSKVLLVAEQQCLFTLYPMVMAAGFKGVQFDRNNELLRGTTAAARAAARGGNKNSTTAAASGTAAASPVRAATPHAPGPPPPPSAAGAWETAMNKALEAANVVLATPKHLQCPCFPCNAFQALVEYGGPSATPAAADGAATGKTADGGYKADGSGVSWSQVPLAVQEAFLGKHHVIAVKLPASLDDLDTEQALRQHQSQHYDQQQQQQAKQQEGDEAQEQAQQSQEHEQNHLQQRADQQHGQVLQSHERPEGGTQQNGQPEQPGTTGRPLQQQKQAAHQAQPGELQQQHAPAKDFPLEQAQHKPCGMQGTSGRYAPPNFLPTPDAAAAAPPAAAAAASPLAATATEPAARSATAIAGAAREPAAQPATAAATAVFAVPVPAEEEEAQQRSLVLNCSPSSLLQQRKALYDAMVQLEQQQQGLVLVERAMPYPDVIMTPATGLCIWGQHNLQLQRRPVEEVVQQMAQTLVNLAPAYESMYYLVELPGEQLQAVMQYAPQLQALAQSLQVRIHMVSSKAAETTKALLPRLCCTAATPYWQSPHHHPITINDRPSQEELALLSCPSLNPLSAALLARLSIQGGSLSLELLTGGCTEQLVQQGVPRRSLELLITELQSLQAADAGAAAAAGGGSDGEGGYGVVDGAYGVPQELQQQQLEQQLGSVGGGHVGAGMGGYYNAPPAAAAAPAAEMDRLQQNADPWSADRASYLQPQQHAQQLDQQQQRGMELSDSGFLGHMACRAVPAAPRCPVGIVQNALHGHMQDYSLKTDYGMNGRAGTAGAAAGGFMPGSNSNIPFRDDQQQQHGWCQSSGVAGSLTAAEEVLPDMDWSVPDMDHGNDVNDRLQLACEAHQQQYQGMYEAADCQDGIGSWQQQQRLGAGVGVVEGALEAGVQEFSAAEGDALDPGNVLEAYLAKRKRGAVIGLQQAQQGGAKRSKPGRGNRSKAGAVAFHSSDSRGAFAAPSRDALPGAGLYTGEALATTGDTAPMQLGQQVMGGDFSVCGNPSSMHCHSSMNTAAAAARGHIAGSSRRPGRAAVRAASQLPLDAGAAGDDTWQELDQIMGSAAAGEGGGTGGDTGWLAAPGSNRNQGHAAVGVQMQSYGGWDQMGGGRAAAFEVGFEALGDEESLGGGFHHVSDGSNFHGSGSAYHEELQEPALDIGLGGRHALDGLGLHDGDPEGVPGGWGGAKQYKGAQLRQHTTDRPAWGPSRAGQGFGGGGSIVSHEWGSSLLGGSNLQGIGVDEQLPAALVGHHTQEGQRARAKMQLGYRATGTSKQTKLCWRKKRSSGL